MSKATLQTWTIDEMLAERPCSAYTRDRLAELWAGRERLSAADFLALPIPNADKVWACLRDPAVAALATPRIVGRAVLAHALHCGVPAVEQWAARWLDGTDRSARAAMAAVTWAGPRAQRLGSGRARRLAAANAAGWAAARAARGRVATEHTAQLDDIRAAIAELEGEMKA